MQPPALLPIYTTRGDVGAYLRYPYLFSPSGEWIGWVTQERLVFSVHGQHVGQLERGPRILRSRSSEPLASRQPPPAPQPVRPPALGPLAPQLPELTFSQLDVLDEWPELLPALDQGELRPDMD